MRKRYDDQLKRIQQQKNKFNRVYRQGQQAVSLDKGALPKEDKLLKYFDIKKPKNLKAYAGSSESGTARDDDATSDFWLPQIKGQQPP